VHEPVRIVEYDPAWARKFADEYILLERIFRGSTAVVEHVGSTAVPGLGAKPIIDIMVGIAGLNEVESRISPLAAIGYEYVPEYEEQLPDRRYFRKPRDGKREYHLHCVVLGSEFWNHHLAFRNYLREHPHAAADYFALKKKLAARYRSNRTGYTEAKSPFIDAILEKC
jgi:GrpB-like predicted nucleotidyltransferase (UPF0157 family)